MKDVLSCVVTIFNDDIRWSLRLAGKVILEDGLDTSGISGLSIKSSTRHMWDHGISSTVLVAHSAPRVILGSGLREPHITTVTTELSGSKRISDIYY